MDPEKSGLEPQQLTQNDDLEKGDHAVQDVDEAIDPMDDARSSKDDSLSGNLKNKSLSEPTTDYMDSEDPFALFPTLSVSMSSTRGPWIRRNTASTLGRQLTRAETLQTIKAVRSRFTEARSEFDEHAYHLANFIR